MLSNDMQKWFELDWFINENIENLSNEDYEFLVEVLENLTQIILAN